MCRNHPSREHNAKTSPKGDFKMKERKVKLRIFVTNASYNQQYIQQCSRKIKGNTFINEEGIERFY